MLRKIGSPRSVAAIALDRRRSSPRPSVGPRGFCPLGGGWHSGGFGATAVSAPPSRTRWPCGVSPASVCGRVSAVRPTPAPVSPWRPCIRGLAPAPAFTLDTRSEINSRKRLSGAYHLQASARHGTGLSPPLAPQKPPHLRRFSGDTPSARVVSWPVQRSAAPDGAISKGLVGRRKLTKILLVRHGDVDRVSGRSGFAAWRTSRSPQKVAPRPSRPRLLLRRPGGRRRSTPVLPRAAPRPARRSLLLADIEARVLDDPAFIDYGPWQLKTLEEACAPTIAIFFAECGF